MNIADEAPAVAPFIPGSDLLSFLTPHEREIEEFLTPAKFKWKRKYHSPSRKPARLFSNDEDDWYYIFHPSDSDDWKYPYALSFEANGDWYLCTADFDFDELDEFDYSSLDLDWTEIVIQQRIQEQIANARLLIPSDYNVVLFG